MGFNPMKMMKVAELIRRFQAGHPKVIMFLQTQIAPGLPEGSILEMTVTKPGCPPVTTNMRVTEEDFRILEELKELQK